MGTPKTVADGSYETPKRTRESEQLLRQFLSTDGPKGNGEAYRKGHERIFSQSNIIGTHEGRCWGCGVEDTVSDDDNKCYTCKFPALRLEDAKCARCRAPVDRCMRMLETDEVWCFTCWGEVFP